MKVSAKTKTKPNPVSVEVEIPDGVDNLVKKYGQEVIGAAAKSAVVISLQAFMRRLIDKGKTVQEIQQAVAAWKPDVRTVVKQSAFEKASASFEKLSPQERAELMKKYGSK